MAYDEKALAEIYETIENKYQRLCRRLRAYLKKYYHDHRLSRSEVTRIFKTNFPGCFEEEGVYEIVFVKDLRKLQGDVVCIMNVIWGDDTVKIPHKILAEIEELPPTWRKKIYKKFQFCDNGTVSRNEKGSWVLRPTDYLYC